MPFMRWRGITDMTCVYSRSEARSKVWFVDIVFSVLSIQIMLIIAFAEMHTSTNAIHS